MMRSSIFIAVALLGIIFLLGCVHIASRDNVDSFNQAGGIAVVKNTIEKGDSVTLYYKGTLTDGTIFDQTQTGSPATFTVGVGNLIPGFDNGLLGLHVGDSKHIEIEAKDAYGEVNPLAIVEVPQQQLLDANIPIIPGITVSSSHGQGKIVDVNGQTATVKIDFNHPLAGKKLIFDVNIVAIKGTQSPNQ
jgi:peptidylprolyl isomerase